MHKRPRALLSSRIAIFAILFFAGLASASAAEADGPDGAGYPQQEFVFNVSSSFPDLRPHRAYNADEAQILTALSEGLFVYDPYNLDPVPALAESWSVSKDGCEWTFRIRGDAFFENGDKITAAVIRDSWLSLLDPALSAPYASLLDPIVGVAAYRAGDGVRKDVGIQAVDATTLKVTLTAPTEHLPKILCHHAFAAVHPSQLADAKKARAPSGYRPISSGPFVVKESSPDEIVFAPNARYWDRANVLLPSLRCRIGKDARELTELFNWGKIHWLAGAVLVDRVSDPSCIRVTPLFSTEYFFFRTTWGPWARREVRQALLLAIPWKELRDGHLIPATTLVFPIAGYPKLDGIATEDAAKARELLAQAGFADPASAPELVIRVPDAEAFKKMTDVLERAWGALGFRVRVEAVAQGEYYGNLRTDDYTLGITSWIGDFADPLSFLEMFRPSSSLNDSGWSNAEYEKLIASAGEARGEERYSRLADAERVLLDDGVILPVAHNPSLNVIDTNGISGWYANALDIHPFKFIRFSPRKALPGVALAGL
ncbi:MAG TPA: peptide ABC transporter substrate-binding protein [Treponemataceae bacterium]|nr:peptide ABC transporter substrate-binding protein [Treponemataceae bacterium]